MRVLIIFIFLTQILFFTYAGKEEIPSLIEEANYYIREGQLEEAIQIYKQVLRINPKHDLAYLQLGNLYLKEGSYNQAIRYFLGLLKVRPDSFLANFNLGLAYLNKKDYRRAIYYFNKAKDIY
ncbi:MAG TPA: tetratricopeptide repeat protein, partial [Candidatus Omnitrophica bacterium]|nr:tetratricopeptide repeat protein [Candidatus Omnitrophota bacterium]